MFKTERSIKKEVAQIKQVLLPSKIVILHMWLPDDDPRHKMSESEIIAKGLREHSPLIIVPNNGKCRPREEAENE